MINDFSNYKFWIGIVTRGNIYLYINYSLHNNLTLLILENNENVWQLSINSTLEEYNIWNKLLSSKASMVSLRVRIRCDS